ncbi:MAG: hypothetical protein WC679_13850, partial [Bacteroidales bacterium]
MQEEIYEKLRNDPRIYLSSFCKIKDKKGSLVPFVVNELQNDLYKQIDENKRIMICKARQMGCSVGMAGYLYHKTITGQGINTVIISYKKEEASALLEIIKLLWESTPEKFRPEVKYNTRYEMSFPRLHSKITVLPSKVTSGRGRTINNLLITELAFWDSAEKVFAGLSQCVPNDGRIIIETTPNGIGNLYYRMWVDPDNGFKKLKYSWDWTYTAEEMEQRRKELGERMWQQEYGLEFLTSGRSVFDAEIVNGHRKNVLNSGYLVVDKMKIYKPPVPGHKYVLSCDPSGGITGGDYTSIIVMDRNDSEEVVFSRSLSSPEN